MFLREGQFITLLLYVDDILIASNSKPEVNNIKTQLDNKFQMKDLGVARKIMGIEIIRQCDLKCLYVSHETYLRKIIEKFGITLKHVSTPFVFHYKLSDDQSPKMVNNSPYAFC